MMASVFIFNNLHSAHINLDRASITKWYFQHIVQSSTGLIVRVQGNCIWISLLPSLYPTTNNKSGQAISNYSSNSYQPTLSVNVKHHITTSYKIFQLIGIIMVISCSIHYDYEIYLFKHQYHIIHLVIQHYINKTREKWCIN